MTARGRGGKGGRLDKIAKNEVARKGIRQEKNWKITGRNKAE